MKIEVGKVYRCDIHGVEMVSSRGDDVTDFIGYCDKLGMPGIWNVNGRPAASSFVESDELEDPAKRVQH